MPELPEVQTTVSGIRRSVLGLRIIDVWTDYKSVSHKGKDNIKDPKYFEYFKKVIVGKSITESSRRAKNILIHLDDSTTKAFTILIHMKMTGHIMHGLYKFDPRLKRDKWVPIEHSGPLADPFNRHIRLVFALSDGSHLVMSDTRRFAKVTLVPTATLHESEHLSGIGPEPLDKKFTFEVFKDRIMLRPGGRIKQVILDQEILAGVGNIYADESLWRAGIHPEERVKNIPTKSLKDLYAAIITTLKKGIDFGGDSMSDYRNIKGERGRFQEHHRAYRKTGTTCERKGCSGTIVRKVIGGRSSHFCDRHQKLSSK